jgi:hypothetical protein
MIDHKPDRVELIDHVLTNYDVRPNQLVNACGDRICYDLWCIGAMEAAWRMGKMIGKCGEKTNPWRLVGLK